MNSDYFYCYILIEIKDLAKLPVQRFTKPLQWRHNERDCI